MDTVLGNMTKTVVASKNMLAALATALLAATFCKVLTFSDLTPITPTTALAVKTESAYSGYQRFTVTAFTGPNGDPSNNSYLTTDAYFQNTTGAIGEQVGSAALCTTIPGSTQATGSVTTTAGVVSAPVVTLGGAGYTNVPTVSVLGGGSGCVITATVVGGVVTALNLVSGGTGYTAATIVIDPPIQIEAYVNFTNAPIDLSQAGFALPLPIQLNLPPS